MKHMPLVPEWGSDGRTARCVPHSRRMVKARCDDKPTVWTELSIRNPVIVLEGRGNRIASRRVPDASRVVIACSNDSAAVRAELGTPQPLLVKQNLKQFWASLQNTGQPQAVDLLTCRISLVHT